MTPRPWQVETHEPIRKLEDDLWMARGAIPEMPMPLLRTMVLARRSDGTVIVHGAMCLDEASMREIEAWGPPSWLVVPNGWHRLDAHAWKQRYPAMKVFCPRSQTKAVSEIVPVDGALEAFPADDRVRAEVFDGFDKEGVLIVMHGEQSTLVFGDMFMNHPHLPGVSGFLYRMVTAATGGPRIHRMLKLQSKKARLRAHLIRLSETRGLVRLIPVHGDVVDENASAVLREAAERM